MLLKKIGKVYINIDHIVAISPLVSHAQEEEVGFSITTTSGVELRFYYKDLSGRLTSIENVIDYLK